MVMEIENPRTYIEDLYSNDPARCLPALRQLKNTVIGSNREKRAVIQQGVLSRLLKFLLDPALPADVQKESIVILTSLAKGAPANAEALVREGTVPILLERTKNPLQPVFEAALKCLRTIAASHPQVRELQHYLELWM